MENLDNAQDEFYFNSPALRVIQGLPEKSFVFVRDFQRLARHHEPTAKHELRVALTVADAAEALGMDPHFGALCAIGHDAGKINVDAGILSITDGFDDRLALMKRVHMQQVRSRLQDMAESDFAPYEKQDVMAVIMAHHEALSYPGYPRSRIPPEALKDTMGGQEFIIRREVPQQQRNWQYLLALSDIADRICWGLQGDTRRTTSDVRAGLQEVAINMRRSLTNEDQQWMSRAIDIVAESTGKREQETIDAAMRILMDASDDRA